MPTKQITIAMGMIWLMGSPGCSAPTDHPGIRSVLDQQVAAWNHGDLEGFMTGYWKSDAMEFSTTGSVTHGWQATLDRYRAKYATAEKMGRLQFSDVCVSERNPGEAEVSGHYRHQTPDGQHTGRFFLHFRQIDGAWVIVKDHTVAD
ncbi:MAG: DUF4440 domain-containing protein [Planctomycetota bacterium]